MLSPVLVLTDAGAGASQWCKHGDYDLKCELIQQLSLTVPMQGWCSGSHLLPSGWSALLHTGNRLRIHIL